MCMVAHSCNFGTEEVEAGGQKFKVILVYKPGLPRDSCRPLAPSPWQQTFPHISVPFKCQQLTGIVSLKGSPSHLMHLSSVTPE